nr:PREDICTED: uncharacterized protein LOC105674302 [Linepithema humile]
MSLYGWTFAFSAKILILNHICQIVCNKTKDTIVILHKLLNNNLDEGLREQTLQFILQIKQRELKFSGMGLFYLGYNFIRQFYVSVATIMVITIQMHFINMTTDIIPKNN